MDALFTAILDDNWVTAKRLLKATPGLATREVEEAKLFEAKIIHWIYVGDTALHLAAAGHRVRLVQLLLAAGANPNAVNNHRQSGPLHYAADGAVGHSTWNAAKQVETIEGLLDAGAKIEASDKNGATPLHRAVRTRSAAAVKCLLDRGADPTAGNKSGSTAFHLAVQNTGKSGSGSEAAKSGQEEIIRLFLARGTSVQLLDGKRKSVLESAQSVWIRNLLCAN